MSRRRDDIPDVAETDMTRQELVDIARELEIDDYESMDDQRLLEELGYRLGQLDRDQPDDSDDSGGSDDADGPDGVDELTRDDLREQLRVRGLSVSGTKAVLRKRLEAADTGGDDEEAGASAAAGEAGEVLAEVGETGLGEPVLELDLGPTQFGLLGVGIRVGRVRAVVSVDVVSRSAVLGRLWMLVATATGKAWPRELREGVIDLRNKAEGQAPGSSDDQNDEPAVGSQDDQGRLRALGSGISRRAGDAASGVRTGARGAKDAVSRRMPWSSSDDETSSSR